MVLPQAAVAMKPQPTCCKLPLTLDLNLDLCQLVVEEHLWISLKSSLVDCNIDDRSCIVSLPGADPAKVQGGYDI